MKINISKKMIGALVLSATLNTTNLFADAKNNARSSCSVFAKYKASAFIKPPNSSKYSSNDHGCGYAKTQELTPFNVGYTQNTTQNYSAYAFAHRSSSVNITQYYKYNGWNAGFNLDELSDEFAYIPEITEGDSKNIEIYQSGYSNNSEEIIDVANKRIVIPELKITLVNKGADLYQGISTMYLKIVENIDESEIDTTLEIDDTKNVLRVLFEGKVSLLGDKLITQGGFIESMFKIEKIGQEEVNVSYLNDFIIDLSAFENILYKNITFCSGVDGQIMGQGVNGRYAITEPNNVDKQYMIEEVKKHSNVLFNLNVTDEYLNVTFEKIAKEKSNFEIIDANGKMVATYNDLTITQNGQMQFSINSLGKGIYFLRVLQNGKYYSKKFIK